ncbi:MAG TPA: cell division FtsA domain-containing protein, partial [Bacillota bacterium]|nr:cell division FtsA domain-containing protein [Bacillota bacterium]
EVARIVALVKDQLEQKTGLCLKKVAVAAAGRALKTIQAGVEVEVDYQQEISRDQVLALELQSIQEAQRQLLEAGDQDEHTYQCVGYTVVNYLLNNQKMRSLVGQRGDKISLEVIATFLPREVVDSLFAVLDRAGLEMTSLTLEPIAASEVVIPETMRQLSVALVDVGAGTSDIAICADGTMCAFAMVPEAGDEITEVLAEKYLLDFNEAERVKRAIANGGQVEYIDILGASYSVSAEELCLSLASRVEELAAKVGEKLRLLSHKPIQAVMCIGGGSQTPGFPKALAAVLNLPEARVAVRTREVVGIVNGSHEVLQGPDAITPLGIGVTAYRGRGLGFLRVMVNDRPVRLFELRKGTVGDALLAAGLDSRKLFGKPGMSLSITLNGNFHVVKGTVGNPAVIEVNGSIAHLDTLLNPGDSITVVEAVVGEDAQARVGDVIPLLEDNCWVLVNNEKILLPPVLKMNGKAVRPDEPLVDLAEVVYYVPDTVEEALVKAGHNNLSSLDITVNGESASLMAPIKRGDIITTTQRYYEEMIYEEIIEETVAADADSGSDYGYQGIHSQEFTTLTVNDQSMTIPKGPGKAAIYDILGYLDFPARAPFPGAEVVLEVNGGPATYTTPLQPGDNVVIAWRESQYRSYVK